MSMKIKYKTEIANCKQVKVYWCSDDKQYICRMFYNAKALKAMDYFTDEKDDAIATAEHMLGYRIRYA